DRLGQPTSQCGDGALLGLLVAQPARRPHRVKQLVNGDLQVARRVQVVTDENLAGRRVAVTIVRLADLGAGRGPEAPAVVADREANDGPRAHRKNTFVKQSPASSG